MKTTMKIKRFTAAVVAIVAAVMMTACNKGGKGDVYVAGHDGGHATLWKNGIAQSLTTKERYSEARSVYVSGNDVYVAGRMVFPNEGPTAFAVLWKNGVAQRLTNVDIMSSEAYSVFVSGTDVYVAGCEPTYYTDSEGFELVNHVAVLWKNGTAQRLTDGSYEAKALSVFVSEGDVYVVGYEGNDAKLWKNGKAYHLVNSSEARSVYVAGNDVYVAGDWDLNPALWEEGAELKLTEKQRGEANAVFVSGKDVYTAGKILRSRFEPPSAAVWKNGKEQEITDRLIITSAESVYVVGKDVYVAGYEQERGKRPIAKLWKNGEEHPLTDEDFTQAFSVFVD